VSGLILGIALALGLVGAALHVFAVMVQRALLTYSRSRLEPICARHGRPERVDRIEANWERTERAASLGAVLSAVLMVAAALEAFAHGFGWNNPDLTIVLLVAAGLALRVIAGVIGRVHAEMLLDRFWPAIGVLNRPVAPLLLLERALEELVRRGDSSRSDPHPRPLSVEVELRGHGSDDGEGPERDLSDATRARLERVLDLEHRHVAEVMIPRGSIVTLSERTPPEEAARTFVESGYSRIPLFGESRDDIVGILYAKDLLAHLTSGRSLSEIRLARIARPALRVPETKDAAGLLDEMRRHRNHLAIALDEHGAISGLVTLEDLLEEIIGPIDDEHDRPEPNDSIVYQSDAVIEVDAGMNLEDLNERLGLDLPTDADFQTVGGLVFDALGRLPEEGETIEYKTMLITVTGVGEHSIRRVRLDLRSDRSLERSPS